MEISDTLRTQLLEFQQSEITGYHIYQNLARANKSLENQQIMQKIANDELKHARLWQKYTGQEVKPRKITVWFYTLLSKLLGFTFAIKLMEMGEEKAQENYKKLTGKILDIDIFLEDENKHEEILIDMLDEESLRYAGSVVLGLNDALVELTGALAGFTLALQNTKLIALTGLITGIAAALSMAASEFLATRAEATGKNPATASLYTGIAYIITVAILILPYLIIQNYYYSLAMTLLSAVLIIAFFNYYISVAKGEPFRRRFLEMAGISLGVAALSFIIGYFIRGVLGIEV